MWCPRKIGILQYEMSLWNPYKTQMSQKLVRPEHPFEFEIYIENDSDTTVWSAKFQNDLTINQVIGKRDFSRIMIKMCLGRTSHYTTLLGSYN